MNNISFDDAPFSIRDDLVAAQQTAWQRIAAPGDWLDGARRVAVAREARNAWSCDLCARRKDALSPYAVAGAHDAVTGLGEVEIEMVHRIATDPGRLSRSWVDDSLAGGLRAEEYIEILSVICMVAMVDGFHRAIGRPAPPLPDPLPGETAGYRAPGARAHDTWLPYVQPGDEVAGDGPLYDSAREPPVVKALSLVPSAKRGYWDLADAHYLPAAEVFNLDTDLRAISRMQMEVLAARVSSVHQCTY
jgi:hypothetical protein